MATTASSPIPTTTTAFSAQLSRLAAAATRALSLCRPWPELVTPSAFSRPATLAAAASRLRRNAAYFRLNYAVLLAASLLVSLLSHPSALLLLALLLAAWCGLYLLRPHDAPPLALLGRAFSDREVLAALSAATFFAVFFTSLASLLVSSLLVGAAAVCVHGALREPDDLFLADGHDSRAAVADLV